MKIALLLPSRERLNMKLTLINSIITSVDDINNVKLYMGIDEDDPTRDISRKIKESMPFIEIVDLKKIPNEKPNIHKMWNTCARASKEEIIAMIGDDMIFRTPGWDSEIIKQFTEGPQDNLILVWGNDTHHGEKCPVNAFVHRKYMDLNGVFLREEFIANWVDTWLLQVFTALGRTRYLPNCIIEHNHWVFGGRKLDKVGKQLLDRDDANKTQTDALWAPLEYKRADEVIKLAKIIGVQPDWKKAGFSEKYWDIKI